MFKNLEGKRVPNVVVVDMVLLDMDVVLLRVVDVGLMRLLACAMMVMHLVLITLLTVVLLM